MMCEDLEIEADVGFNSLHLEGANRWKHSRPFPEDRHCAPGATDIRPTRIKVRLRFTELDLLYKRLVLVRPLDCTEVILR